MGYTFGTQGSGFNVNAGVSKGSGNSNGNSTTWRNTTLTAGNQINLQSGGDTTLKGAVAKADNIKANAGGDLKLESLQDSDTYHSKSSSSSASIGYTFGTSMGSISANHSNTKMNSDYLSVGEQTGLLAGSQGFQINVNGNTDLKGAKISSNQTAIDNHKNQLTTATLTTSDIQNHAEYDASSSSIGGGYSFKGDKVGQNQQGQATSGNDAVPGKNLPGLNGFSATAPVAMNASGDASSTTKAGISHADITITDEAKQRELTGKDAATTISELNRDVSSDKDTSNSLNPIFDPDKIQANFDIVSAFSRETGTFLNNRAQETTNAKKALDEELAKPKDQQDASKIAQLSQVIQNNATWEMGGTGRRLLTAITAAASGNVTGSGAQFIQSATVNYLQSLGAEQVKHLVDSFKGTTAEKETARAALQGLLACGGAAAQGASCGSAASGAAASVVLNNLVSSLTGKKAEDMTAEEKQAQENLVTSLITGITAEAGGDAAVATAAAQIEIENNSLGKDVEGAGLIAVSLPLEELGVGEVMDAEAFALLSEDAQALVKGSKTLEELTAEKGETYVTNLVNEIKVVADNGARYANEKFAAQDVFGGRTIVENVTSRGTSIESIPGGTQEMADADFNSMGLQDIRTIQTPKGEVRMGTTSTGETVKIRPSNDGGNARPTIEIINQNGRTIREVRYGDK